MISITSPTCLRRNPSFRRKLSISARFSCTGLPLFFSLSLLAFVNAGCSKSEPTKDELVSRANAAFAADQFDQAEKEYREVLRTNAEDPTALRQLGIIYFNQGQLPQAYPLLKKAVELRPEDPEAQLKYGVLLLSLREFAQARDAALEVLEMEPGRQEALLVLADASRTPDDKDDARKRIQRLREKDQDRSGYHVALGALDLQQNEQERAEKEFKAALDLDPKSSDAYSGLAALYWTRNDLREADQALKTAAELAPPRAPVSMRYVDFKLRTGDTAGAKAILEEMTRKSPDYLPPRVYLMKMACAENNKDEGCATLVKNVLGQDGANFDALFLSGSRHLVEGNAEMAVREFEQLASLYGNNPQVRYQLARAYLLYANGNNAVKSRELLDAAERNLSQAIELNPKADPAILLLAELKLKKGNAAAAADLLLPLTKERPQLAQAQSLLASVYLTQNKPNEALAVYRQMTELFPKDPQPSFLTGVMLLSQRQQQAARAAFEQSVAISPDYLPPTEKLVDLDIAEKLYAAAADRVQKIIDRDPKLAQAWGLKAKIYLAERDFTHAEPDLLKAIELDPKLEPAYELLAQLYLVTNRPEEAIAKLNSFLEKNNTVPAIMQLAMINEQLKRFDAARDAYEKALSIAPNLPLALNNLAVLYSEHFGKLDKAYELANKAKEILSEPHINDTLGWILFKRGDYANALPLLQDSASKLPNFPEAQFHVGMAHYMMGEEAPARIALQKAVDSSGGFPAKDEARRRLKLLTMPMGQLDPTARVELESYLREYPNDPAALVRLAELQQQDGTVDQAVKTYEKVLSDDPLYGPATRQLAKLYGQRHSDDPKAFDVVNRARQSYPDDPEIAKALGILNYRRGYYPQSVELLKEAARNRKHDAEVLYYLGEDYNQLKQWNECKDTVRQALAMNLPPELASNAKRILAVCSDPTSEEPDSSGANSQARPQAQ
jgi:tetratricopeptide (TPR) repeat protein